MDRIGSFLGRYGRLAAVTLLVALASFVLAPDARAQDHHAAPAVADHAHHAAHHADHEATAPTPGDEPGPHHRGDCHCVSAACSPVVAPVLGSLTVVALPRAGHPLPPSYAGRHLAEIPPLAEPPEA